MPTDEPFTRYDLPCPHEQGHLTLANDDDDWTYPNYHPLTRDDLAALLTRAQQTDNTFTAASIQVRLTQAIPGMVCPTPLVDDDDPALAVAAQKAVWLDDAFVDHREAGALVRLAEAFWALLRP